MDGTGYLNHGQREGPKIDVAPNQGGTIADAREASHFTSSPMLYTVRWDDGKVSKHYADELFCVGRFQTRKEFEAAIKPTGAVELTLGPAGGFRSVRLDLEFDGQAQTTTLSKQHKRLWSESVEPLVKRLKLRISTKKLEKAQ